VPSKSEVVPSPADLHPPRVRVDWLHPRKSSWKFYSRLQKGPGERYFASACCVVYALADDFDKSHFIRLQFQIASLPGGVDSPEWLAMAEETARLLRANYRAWTERLEVYESSVPIMTRLYRSNQHKRRECEPIRLLYRWISNRFVIAAALSIASFLSAALFIDSGRSARPEPAATITRPR